MGAIAGADLLGCAAMSETQSKTYSGSCHCGHVKFEVEMELKGVIQGNCSMCSRTGALLAFVKADQFKLVSGDNLPDYQFNKRNVHYVFCPTCGIRSFARGTGPHGSAKVAAWGGSSVV